MEVQKLNIFEKVGRKNYRDMVDIKFGTNSYNPFGGNTQNGSWTNDTALNQYSIGINSGSTATWGVNHLEVRRLWYVCTVFWSHLKVTFNLRLGASSVTDSRKSSGLMYTFPSYSKEAKLRKRISLWVCKTAFFSAALSGSTSCKIVKGIYSLTSSTCTLTKSGWKHSYTFKPDLQASSSVEDHTYTTQLSLPRSTSYTCTYKCESYNVVS